MKTLRVVVDHKDEVPELIVDQEFKNPTPLDRRIATVALRTPTNNPTEGYDLLLSATFGRERVILKSEDFEIDVDFSLSTADVELQFVRCSYALINSDQGGRVQEGKTTISERAGLQTMAAGNIGIDLSSGADGSVDAKARASGRYEKALTANATMHRHVTRHDWHRLGGEAIQVGPAGKTLDGPMISDFAGWRVKPTNTAETSGVVARVRVRENWINFDDVQIRKAPTVLMHRVRDLLSPGKKKRKEYFQVLLRHLAQSELRDHQDGLHATIAAHVIVVRPFEEHAMSPYGGPTRQEIAIDGKRVADFLMSEDGHEAGALIALGVHPDVIAPVAESDENAPEKRGTFFIPDSSPPHAEEQFKQIYTKKSVRKAELLYPTTLHDLRALNLVRGQSDTVELMASAIGIKPGAILRRAVSEMACIKVARGVLRINPDATAIDIADAVALELGKHWHTLGTKMRNGNAIKRWTIWLEPHLLDPQRSSEAAAAVAYATDPNVTKKGRPPSLRKSLARELKRLVAEGKTPAEIAKEFNVTRQSIYVWKKRLRLK
jgi:hypothetical protein